MSKKSILSVFLTKFRRSIGIPNQETYFVGQDGDGNRYYEKKAEAFWRCIKKRKRKVTASAQEGSENIAEADTSLVPYPKYTTKRGSRWFETKDKIGPDELPDIPLEWDAWLRGNRQDPPTQEEINSNLNRSLKTVARAKKLKEQAELEREKMRQSAGAEKEFYQGSTIDSKNSGKKFPEYEDLETNPNTKKR